MYFSTKKEVISKVMANNINRGGNFMNQIIINNKHNIKDLIYEVRGKQVMLDSDLANLYECTNGTKDVNKAVKRNIERFPEDFYFQLTEEEYRNLRSQSGTAKEYSPQIALRSQIGTLNNRFQIGTAKSESNLRFQNGTTKSEAMRRSLPYVFTEQGVAMLTSVLKTKVAAAVSIDIMRTFVKMRHFLMENAHLFQRLTHIDQKILEHDKQFNVLFNELRVKEAITNQIFYKGQIYDAYDLLVKLVKKANKQIVIIDNYVDDTILKLLAKKKKNSHVLVITNPKNKHLSSLDIIKFNKQYPTLTLKYSNDYHDRFLILDDEIYHLRASLKDLGTKCFAINKIKDTSLLEKIKDLYPLFIKP